MAKIIHTNVGVGIETLGEWMGEDIHALDEDGLYKAYFVCILPSGGERTHKIEYEILANPQENR